MAGGSIYDHQPPGHSYPSSHLLLLLRFSVGHSSFRVDFAAATNLSITAGYHRLFSHKSYDAHPIAKAMFLLIGASGFQGSALKWCSDHRRHHMHIDGEKDPYNIHKGFTACAHGLVVLQRYCRSKNPSSGS